VGELALLNGRSGQTTKGRNVKPQAHFRDASAWMAKAPPMLKRQQDSSACGGVVLRFPIERIRQGRKGLAGGAE
jgi:hypothetical protein